MLTRDILSAFVSYDPESGEFARKKKVKGSTKKVGDLLGSDDGAGYVQISVCGKVYRAHRLAFLYMTGRIPKYIDHINHDKSDNSWANLRECSKAENSFNRTAPANNTSGYRGVSLTRNKKWKAESWISGKKINLGVHDTPERADIACRIFRYFHHGEFYCQK